MDVSPDTDLMIGNLTNRLNKEPQNVLRLVLCGSSVTDSTVKASNTDY